MKKSLFVFGMFAFISMGALAETLNIKTGSEGGGYHRIGLQLGESIKREGDKKGIDIDTKYTFSNGTIENLNAFGDNEADVVLVQADGLNLYPPVRPFKASKGPLETVFWIYNKEYGISDLADIEGSDKYIIAVVDDSGAKITLDSFVKEDSGYKKNADTAFLADDLFEAAATVSEGKYEGKRVAGMLYVGTTLPTDITTDFSKNLLVGTLTGDGDFNDALDINKEALYTSCEVTKQQRKNINTKVWGDPDTLCVRSMVLYASTHDNKEIKKVIRRGVVKATAKY